MNFQTKKALAIFAAGSFALAMCGCDKNSPLSAMDVHSDVARTFYSTDVAVVNPSGGATYKVRQVASNGNLSTVKYSGNLPSSYINNMATDNYFYITAQANANALSYSKGSLLSDFSITWNPANVSYGSGTKPWIDCKGNVVQEVHIGTNGVSYYKSGTWDSPSQSIIWKGGDNALPSLPSGWTRFGDPKIVIDNNSYYAVVAVTAVNNGSYALFTTCGRCPTGNGIITWSSWTNQFAVGGDIDNQFYFDVDLHGKILFTYYRTGSGTADRVRILTATITYSTNSLSNSVVNSPASGTVNPGPIRVFLSTTFPKKFLTSNIEALPCIPTCYRGQVESWNLNSNGTISYLAGTDDIGGEKLLSY